MSMKMVCNRCNKVKEDGEYFDHIDYMPTLKEYDLCPECSKLFSIFMDGGTVEEDRYKDSKPCTVVESSIDKEESDLSVKTHTNVAGVTVPDSEPWSEKRECSTCKYRLYKYNVEPCHTCILTDKNNYTPKEKTNEQSSET